MSTLDDYYGGLIRQRPISFPISSLSLRERARVRAERIRDARRERLRERIRGIRIAQFPYKIVPSPSGRGSG